MVFLGDVVMILSALLFTFYVRFRPPIREWGINAPPEIGEYSGYIILALLLYVGMLSYGGVYQHRKLLQLRTVTGRILKWSVAWVGLILLGSFLLKFQPPVSRIYCLMAWVITPTILVIWRSIFQLLLIRTSALPALKQRVVFVGWNEYAARLAHTFNRSADSAYQVIGYIHGRADQGTEPSIAYLD
jgi:FlaA1/EpsC-like NDP-sugar epimerase